MNWRTISKRLARGEFHYALGRFYSVRRAYSAISRINHPPDRYSLNSSLFSAELIGSALTSLSSDAVALGFDLPPQTVAEIRGYAEYGRCHRSGDRQQFKFPEVKEGMLADGEPVVLGIVDNPRACPAVSRICSDPVLLQIATRYLGYCPTRIEPRLYWSFVCNAMDELRLSCWQTIRYHFDVDGFNFLYFNFYVVDVDAGTGPHAYIRGSHKRKPWRMMWHSANQTDDIVYSHFGMDTEAIIEGPAGFGFIEDASCYHKAIPPQTRPRLMLQIRVG